GTVDRAYYPSFDTAFDAGQALLGTRSVTGGLTVGSYSAYALQSVTLPAWAPGNYHILAVVNPTGAASEYSTANNVSSAQPISVVSASCTDDSYEPDSSFSAANPITLGAAPQPHTH